MARPFEDSAEAIEQALTDPACRARWLSPPATPDSIPLGDPEPLSIEDTLWAYRMDFGSDEVRLRFAHGLLRVDQVFGGREPWNAGLAAGRCAAGWETCFGRLRTVLAGGAPRASTLAVARAMDATKWMGQDSGAPRLTVDGDLLRFDRDLLGLDPQRLWAMLYADGAPAEVAVACGLTAAGITEATPGSVLEFDVRHGVPAGSVRWELHEDPQYGRWVRMDHLVDEDAVSELYMFLASWQLHIEALLRRAHGLSLGTLDPNDEYTIEMLAEHLVDKYPDVFADPGDIEDFDDY
ncbi:hypothetical protein [Sciscionella marina]|uniref:hypothetical protein n=1 Tax=Sciscionella marina TaxID=508770 RepID=UPI00036C30B2|nr:hypothetical protein [Sciscionella marina]